MRLGRIMQRLEQCDATGAQAVRVARLAFLDWVCAADGPVTAQMARAALESVLARGAESAAARAFVEMLGQASRGRVASPLRRGRARLLQ